MNTNQQGCPTTQEQCTSTTLHCQICKGYCKKYFPQYMERLSSVKKTVLTQNILQKLSMHGRIFRDIASIQKDKMIGSYCYDDNEFVKDFTDLEFLGGGGGGDAYKKCLKTDDEVCYVYKITPMKEDIFSLDATAIMFILYMSYLAGIDENQKFMSTLVTYGNFMCSSPPDRERSTNKKTGKSASEAIVKPSNRVFVSVIEFAQTDLLKLIQSTPLPICVFKGIVLDVLIALTYWGHFRINHNDLKADNIFITYQGPEMARLYTIANKSYAMNYYGIKPILADYDWATFDLPEKFREKYPELGTRSRYYNDRIATENYSLGWRWQSKDFDPYYDVFSFLVELLAQLMNIVYGPTQYSEEMRKQYKLVIYDFYPFVITCTGLHYLLPRVFDVGNGEAIANQYITQVLANRRMYRRSSKDLLINCMTPGEILSYDVNNYFSQFY